MKTKHWSIPNWGFIEIQDLVEHKTREVRGKILMFRLLKPKQRQWNFEFYRAKSGWYTESADK